MLYNKTVSVVIPCKNEEYNIVSTIKGLPKYVDEIIVVDNGSTDNTAQVARASGAIVVSEPRKYNGVGYGYAHMTGYNVASGDFIVTLDGDSTYPAYVIKDVIYEMLKNGWDFVSCNRLPLRDKNAISKIRRLGIYILNLEVVLLYGYPIKDILTGMWLFKKSILPKLHLHMGDWNLSPEIKLSAIVAKDINFAEYHIDHFERGLEPSKQKIWKTGFSHLLYILKRRVLQDSLLRHLSYFHFPVAFSSRL